MQPTRILVVEDQLALRNLIERYLRRMGFEVESMSESPAALEHFRASKTAFQIVLADMTMPGLSGEELLRSIFHSDPNVCGILCSGYAIGPTKLESEYPGRVEFLQKPFLPQALADTIKKLLNARIAGAGPDVVM